MLRVDKKTISNATTLLFFPLSGTNQAVTAGKSWIGGLWYKEGNQSTFYDWISATEEI